MKKIVNSIEKLNESEQRIFLNVDGSNKELLDLQTTSVAWSSRSLASSSAEGPSWGWGPQDCSITEHDARAWMDKVSSGYCWMLQGVHPVNMPKSCGNVGGGGLSPSRAAQQGGTAVGSCLV